VTDDISRFAAALAKTSVGPALHRFLQEWSESRSAGETSGPLNQPRVRATAALSVSRLGWGITIRDGFNRMQVAVDDRALLADDFRAWERLCTKLDLALMTMRAGQRHDFDPSAFMDDEDE